MEIKIIMTVIGTIMSFVGVTLVFEARTITKKVFGFGDQNEGTVVLKWVGFIIGILGAFIVFFNIR